jgi:hypothetical protein
MKHKVKHKEKRAVGQEIVDVEEKSVHAVLDDRPHKVAEEEACSRNQDLRRAPGPVGWMGRDLRLLLEHAADEETGSDGKPDYRHDPPLGASEDLEVVGAKESRRLGEMSGLVDLLEVKVLGEGRVEDLAEQRLAQVEELVRLEVVRDRSLLGIKVLGEHDVLVADACLTTKHADLVLGQKLVRRVRVRMLVLARHHRSHVLACVFEHELLTPRMVSSELGHIVDPSLPCQPAFALERLLLDIRSEVDFRALRDALRHGRQYCKTGKERKRATKLYAR